MLVHEPLFRQIVRFGLVVATARIGILCYLFTRQAMGHESLDEVLLVLILLPEGLLLPRGWSWTLGRLIGASVALFVSSLLITAIVLVIVRVAVSAWRSSPKLP